MNDVDGTVSPWICTVLKIFSVSLWRLNLVKKNTAPLLISNLNIYPNREVHYILQASWFQLHMSCVCNKLYKQLVDNMTLIISFLKSGTRQNTTH